jgi:hypothetical protein
MEYNLFSSYKTSSLESGYWLFDPLNWQGDRFEATTKAQ